MSLLALDRLVAGEETLVSALDAGDLAAIDHATHALRGALADVVASGGWHARPELRARLTQALRLAEAAGGRINYLADRTRRQLDRLAALGGAPRAGAYSRSGRLS